MKISTIALSALLVAAIQVSAQTKAQNPKPAKQKQKTKQEAKPKKDKARASNDSIKPINKNPDHYYCPPCGMG